MISIQSYTIKNSNIPTNFDNIKIAHISDIHYKTIVDKKQLIKLVDKINLAKPDIVIISGDLLDNSIKYSIEDQNDIIEALSSIDDNLGKYIIKGENDTNTEVWNSIIANTDFIDLNDKYDTVYNDFDNPIMIAGMSSNYDTFSNTKLESIYSLISDENNNIKYRILVMHEPDFIDKINYDSFDLILAGHTMGGYINIFGIKNLLLPEYSKKYYKPYYKLNNTDIYINNGVGNHSIKFRLFNQPTINIYTLKTKK